MLRMEWKIVFRINHVYILKLTTNYIVSYYQTRMRIFSHFLVPQCKFLACCDCIVLLR